MLDFALLAGSLMMSVVASSRNERLSLEMGRCRALFFAIPCDLCVGEADGGTGIRRDENGGIGTNQLYEFKVSCETAPKGQGILQKILKC